MNHEMRLAKALGYESTETEKLASAYESLSIEELEAIVRGEMKKTSSIHLSVEWADQMGREMAKEAAPAMGLLQKGIGTAASKILSTGAGTRAAVGAGVGAVGGALKNPGVDPATGQQRSRLKNMAIGAGLGAGAGAAAGKAVTGIGSMNNAMGRYVGGATKQVAKQTGNATALQAATGMQIARGQKASALRATRQAAKVPGAAPAAQPGVFQRAGEAAQKGWNKVKEVANSEIKLVPRKS